MASFDNQNKCGGISEFVAMLASEGVEFLLSHQGKVGLDSLSGKTVCLLFSANWCKPCKAFLPQLVQLYRSLRQRGKELEIVFVSLENDETAFSQHFWSMPWLAVPFNSSLHRQLSVKYKVNHIPSLVPLSLDGPLIGKDAIGLIEDYGDEAFPFTWKRREQLKAIDNAKRHSGSLEKLLTYEARDYVVYSNGRKIPVSQLAGKTVGLYFGAHWSPPCCSFTAQLMETYSELNITDRGCFEIVFVSTDRDKEEFNVNTGNMPWPAIPFTDRACQDLYRIFQVKNIPTLVLIGPEGKTVNANGKAMVSLYGAKAFPFTESRVTEIESALKKEGEALPQEVRDVKHEHVLKLDMAKAYVCDYCKEQGKFWAFSCAVCDYDLHPSCVEEQTSLIQ